MEDYRDSPGLMWVSPGLYWFPLGLCGILWHPMASYWPLVDILWHHPVCAVLCLQYYTFAMACLPCYPVHISQINCYSHADNWPGGTLPLKYGHLSEKQSGPGHLSSAQLTVACPLLCPGDVRILTIPC